MATEIDICNLALAKLGDSATVSSISPPEGSAQAEHCARFYPIARGVFLESHNWNFSTKRKALGLLTSDSFNWSFAYSVPSDCLKVISILPPDGGSEDDSQEYEIESGDSSNIILTNQEDAVIKYIQLVTDIRFYSSLAVDALSWLLASYLAGPLIKSDAGAAAATKCYQAYRIALGKAAVEDSNQRKVRPDHNPDWISNR